MEPARGASVMQLIWGWGASLCRYEMILVFQRSSDLLISSSDPFLSVYAVWIYAKAVTTQFQIIYMSLP